MLCALLLASTAAAASEFGHLGQVLPSGGVSLFDSSQADDSELFLSLRPEVGYFVLEHFAVGGGLDYEIVKRTVRGVDQPSVTYAGVVAFVAYDLGLDRYLSLFPSAGGYLVQRGSLSGEVLGVNLFLPLLFHPAPHCFLGLGPEASLDLSAPNDLPKRTQLGARSTIGVYF